MEIAESHAEAKSENMTDSYDWLYPELLSKDSLVEILRQRYIRHTDLKQLKKDQLLDLYYKYIIPLPQRTYRKNRRGKEMTNRQIARAKKRKTSIKDIESSNKKEMETAGSESRLLTSYKLPVLNSKNLALTSCINFEKKKIKLTSSSSSSNSELSNNKPGGRISLKRGAGISFTCVQQKETEDKCSLDSPKKKIIKPINKSMPSAKQRDTFKRNTEESTLMYETSNQDVMNSPMDNSTKMKFKAKKIAWP